MHQAELPPCPCYTIAITQGGKSLAGSFIVQDRSTMLTLLLTH